MVIGVTGGLATGKSRVTRLLRDRGAIVFSADEAARAVAQAGSPLLQELTESFGRQILLPDGTLDRTRLAKRIFADSGAREQLNRIMHPAILGLLSAQIESAQKDYGASALIAVEMPLLFEANLTRWFERILVVTASEAMQIARLKARNSLDELDARQRLAAQWPVSEKAARADYVIYNEGSLADLEQAVTRVWEQIKGSLPVST